MASTGAVPDEVVVVHNVAGQFGKWKFTTERLYDEDGDPRWLEHPRHGRRVDVVALPLTSKATSSSTLTSPQTQDPRSRWDRAIQFRSSASRLALQRGSIGDLGPGNPRVRAFRRLERSAVLPHRQPNATRTVGIASDPLPIRRLRHRGRQRDGQHCACYAIRWGVFRSNSQRVRSRVCVEGARAYGDP
jgi:hypothetical protein